MKPNVVQPLDPIFCSVCGSRLPEKRAADEGLHCDGTIVTPDPAFPDDPKKATRRACLAIYWPQTASGVVVVLQPVIRENETIGVLEVQRMGRGGVVRPPDEGWCFPSGFTKFGNAVEEDGEREVVEESGAAIELVNLIVTDENGDHAVFYTNSIVLDAETATEGHLMVLVLAKPVHERDLAPFVANRETSARRIGTPDARLLFSIHRRWKKLYFSGHYAAQSARLPAPI